MSVADNDIRTEILAQIGEKQSVAPRDVAQKLASEGEDWRKLLPRIRRMATALHGDGLLAFIRKKKTVSPTGLKGVYRLARPGEESPGESPKESPEESTGESPNAG